MHFRESKEVMAEMEVNRIGMVGLGPMGRSLSLNLLDKHIDVVGYDLDPGTLEKASSQGIKVASSLQDLVNCFGDGKKAIWIMIPAGKVDAFLRELFSYLSPGDIVIEGGNSHFEDTERRVKQAESEGLVFIGTGISGGEEGALKGPCIMPGGSETGYRVVEPILKAIAAKVNSDACCAYMGPGGAGHFVKMVHNGIEYAIMQAIAETYHILKDCLGLSTEEIHNHFSLWTDESIISGYLMEITTHITRRQDHKTGRPIVEIIKDTAKQKGTGKWTSQKAYDLGVPVHSLSAALLARFISAQKDQRTVASSVLEGPASQYEGDKEEFIQQMYKALEAAIRIAYSQGFALLKAGSEEYNYHLPLAEIAHIWRGGCIIRSRLLPVIEEALREESDLPNLMLSSNFSKVLNENVSSLRAVVQAAISCGVPVPVLSQSISYFDSYRAKILPTASLIQAMRDYFGSHTYERFDEPGIFHTLWTQPGYPEQKK